MITFQDAVTAGNLNPDAAYAAGYVDGRYANIGAIHAHCPHAKILTITVLGGIAEAVDSETGDLDVPQTVKWVAERVAAGQQLIVVYANESRWKNEGLEAQLAHYAGRIKRWMAKYDNVAQVPAGFDAKQYADPGPVDNNIALDSFFGAVVPSPKPHPSSSGLAKFSGTYDIGKDIWSIRGEPGANVKLVGPKAAKSAALQLEVGAGGGGWTIHRSN